MDKGCVDRADDSELVMLQNQKNERRERRKKKAQHERWIKECCTGYFLYYTRNEISDAGKREREREREQCLSL
jgi:hypothetical protein